MTDADTHDRAAYTASASPLASFRWCDHPLVTFITVTYGTGAVISESLRALSESIDGIDAEVIVVDNPHPLHGHRCADRLSIDTSGVLVLRPEHNLGFGGGNEWGVLHSRGELLCFVNPDLITTPGWFEPLLDEIRQAPDCIVAPRLIDRDGTLQEAGQQLSSNGNTQPITDAGSLERADYASAACWLMTRSLHERSGGFDPRYHPAYFEDVDLALRVRRLGGRTIVADTSVIHLLGGSTVDGHTPPAEAQRSVLQKLWGDELLRQPVD